MSKGFVYVLTNPCMPGIVKIGKTNRSAQHRADEIYQTGVPMPFVVFAEVATPDCDRAEHEVHAYYAEKRVSPAREFFRADAEEAIQTIRDVIREQVEDLVAEYLGDFNLVESDCFVDPSIVSQKAYLCGVYCPDMANVFDELAPEELAPAVARHEAKTQARISKYKSGQEAHHSRVAPPEGRYDA